MDQLTYLRTIFESLQAKKRELEEAEDLVVKQYNATLEQIQSANNQDKKVNVVENKPSTKSTKKDA